MSWITIIREIVIDYNNNLKNDILSQVLSYI